MAYGSITTAVAAILVGSMITVPAAMAKPKVLINATVHTVNPDTPSAQAIAINDAGIIVAVGTEEEARAATPDADIIDLTGKMVLPGFQDAHMHPVEAGVNKVRCTFQAFVDLDVTRKEIADCLEKNTDTTKWVLGSGINMASLLKNTNDPKALLDEVSQGRRMLILDDIGHSALANTAALKDAGYYNMPVKQPDGGIILTIDGNPNGEPNGIVLENAQQKLRNLASPPTSANVDFAYEKLLSELRLFAQNGITSVSDAGGFWQQGHDKVWQKALDNKTLTVRASNALYVYPDLPFDKQMMELKNRYSSEPNSLLRVNQAKIYVDGILSQRTGAVLQDYEPNAEGIAHDYTKRGFFYFDPGVLNRYSSELSKEGFQLHYHVTGDDGARTALKAIEQSDLKYGPHRLTHLYLIDKTDYPRFKQSNVVADFQLAPSSLSDNYKETISKLIGDRVERLMPAASLAKAGANVVMSSDYDADTLPPLLKIQAAVMRKNEGAPNVATAIEWMTINPARLLQQDKTTGSIEVDKFADLVVIDQNILNLSTEKIGGVTVVATLLQGKPVYDPGKLFNE